MYKVSLDINKANNTTTTEAAAIPARSEIIIPIDLNSCYFPVDERQKIIKEVEQKRRAREEAKKEACRAVEGAENIEVEPREFNPVLHARQEERKAKERAILSQGKAKHGEFSLGATLTKIASSTSTTTTSPAGVTTTTATSSPSSPSVLTSPSAAGTPRARREQAKLQQQQLAANNVALTTEKNDLQKKGLHARQVRKAIATSIDALRNASEEDAQAYKQYCTKIVADRARERNAERLKIEAERKRQMRLINPEGNYSSSSLSSDDNGDRSGGDSPPSHNQYLRRVRPPKIKQCHPSTEGTTANRVYKARRRRQYELTQTVMDPLPSSCISRPTQAAVNLHDRQTAKERIHAMEIELQNMSSSSSSSGDEDVLLNSGTRKSTILGSSVRRPPSALGSSVNSGGGRRSTNRLGQSIIIGDTYGCNSTHRSSAAATHNSQHNPPPLPPPKYSPRAPSKRDQLRMRINEMKGSTTVAHRRRLREDRSVSPPPASSPRSRSPLNTTNTALTSTTASTKNTPTKASTSNVKVRPPQPPPTSTLTATPAIITKSSSMASASVTTAHERHQQGLLSREGDSVHLRRWMAMIFVANSMMSLTAPVIRQRLCFHNKIAKVPLSQAEVDTGVHLKFTRPVSPNTYDSEMRKKAKEEAKRERRAKRREQRRLLLEKQLSSVGSMWMRTKSGHAGGLSSQQTGPRSLSTTSSDSSSGGSSSDGSDLDNDGSLSFGGGDHHPSTQQPTTATTKVGMNLGDIINATNNTTTNNTSRGVDVDDNTTVGGVDVNSSNLASYNNNSVLDASFDYSDDKALPPQPSSSQKALDMRSMVVVGGALSPVPNTTFGCPVSVDFAHVNNVPTQITTIHATRTAIVSSDDRSRAAGRSNTSGGSHSVSSQPQHVHHNASYSPTYSGFGGTTTTALSPFNNNDKQAVVAVVGYHALLPYINFSHTFAVEAKRIRAAMTLDKCSLRISLYLRIFKKRSAVAYIARFLQERKLVLDLRDGASYYRRCVVSAQRAVRRRRVGVEVVIEHWKQMWREWEIDLAGKIVEDPSDDDVSASLSNTTASRPTTSHLSSSNAMMAPKQQVLRRRKPKRMTLHDALETPGLKPWFLEDLQAVSGFKYDFPTVCTIASTDGESVLSGKISEEKLTMLMQNVHVSVVHQRTVLRRRRVQYLRQLRSTTVTTSDGDAQRQLDDAQRTDAAVNKQVPIRGVGKRDILGLLVYSVLNGGAQAAAPDGAVGGSTSEVSSVLGGSGYRESREASRKGGPNRLNAHNARPASRPRSPRTQSTSASARPSVFRRYSSRHEGEGGGGFGVVSSGGGRLSNASSTTSLKEPTLPTVVSASPRVRRITVRAPSIPHTTHPSTSREGRRGTSSSTTTPSNTTTATANNGTVRRSSVIFVTPPME